MMNNFRGNSCIKPKPKKAGRSPAAGSCFKNEADYSMSGRI